MALQRIVAHQEQLAVTLQHLASQLLVVVMAALTMKTAALVVLVVVHPMQQEVVVLPQLVKATVAVTLLATAQVVQAVVVQADSKLTLRHRLRTT